MNHKHAFIALALLLSALTTDTCRAAGQIAGVVTDGRTGQPVAGAMVEYGRIQAFAGFGASGSPIVTGADGAFAFADVPATDWALRVRPVAPLLAILWPTYFCSSPSSCGMPFLGGNFFVVDDQTTTINVTTTSAGSIGGRVTADAGGAALTGSTVTITKTNFISTGYFQATATTDGSGNYRIDGVVPGNYEVTASNLPGYVSETFDNLPCVGSCDNPTLVPVVSDLLSANINFGLAVAGKVSGTVHDDGNTALLHGNLVSLYSDNSGTLTAVATRALDRDHPTFEFVGLAAGTYRLATLGFTQGPTYRQEVYPDLPCAAASCSNAEISTGPGIVLESGQSATGLDIGLQPAGSMSGCIATPTPDNQPIPGVAVTAYFYTTGPFGGYRPVSSAVTGSNGCYTITHLPDSSSQLYRLRTINHAGYIDQVHNGFPCLPSCDYLGGNTLALAFDQDLTLPGIALAPGPTIRGRVIAADTGLAIADARVEVFNTSTFVRPFGDDALSPTTANGDFRTVALTAGIYYLRASVSAEHYAGQHVYGAVNCFSGQTNCPLPQQGTPITFSAAGDLTGLIIMVNRDPMPFVDGFE